MPGFNGMGPGGMGPVTGRGLGYCTQGTRAGDMVGGRGMGRGQGGGFGGGRGFGGGFGRGGGVRNRAWGQSRGFGSYDRGFTENVDEIQSLRERAAFLEEELAAIRKRVSETEKGGG